MEEANKIGNWTDVLLQRRAECALTNVTLLNAKFKKERK